MYLHNRQTIKGSSQNESLYIKAKTTRLETITPGILNRHDWLIKTTEFKDQQVLFC